MRIDLTCACGMAFAAESRPGEWLGAYEVQKAAKEWEDRHEVCRLVVARGLYVEQTKTPHAEARDA